MSIFEDCDDLFSSFNPSQALKAPTTPLQKPGLQNSCTAEILSDLELSPESLMDTNYTAAEEASNNNNASPEYVNMKSGTTASNNGLYAQEMANCPFDIDEILSGNGNNNNNGFGSIKKEDNQYLFISPSKTSSYPSIKSNQLEGTSLTSSASSNTLFSLNNDRNSQNAAKPLHSSSSSPSLIGSFQKLTSNTENVQSNTMKDKKVTKPFKQKKQKKQKSSHNMIEKRYRTNINNKIAILKNCVPSLRVAASSSNTKDICKYIDSGNDCNEEAVGSETQLDGLEPARKLNKATILSKATEYILHLQKRNEELAQQNQELQDKLALTNDAVKKEEKEFSFFNGSGFSNISNEDRSSSLSSLATAVSENDAGLYAKMSDFDSLDNSRALS